MINDFSTIYLQGSKRDTSGFTRRDRDTELKVPFDQQEEEEKGEQNRWLMSISDALFLPSPFEGVYVAREELYAMHLQERPRHQREAENSKKNGKEISGSIWTYKHEEREYSSSLELFSRPRLDILDLKWSEKSNEKEQVWV